MLKDKQRKMQEAKAILASMEQDLSAKHLEDTNHISPLEYQLNKSKFNKLGYSPEKKTIVIKNKFG